MFQREVTVRILIADRIEDCCRHHCIARPSLNAIDIARVIHPVDAAPDFIEVDFPAGVGVRHDLHYRRWHPKVPAASGEVLDADDMSRAAAAENSIAQTQKEPPPGPKAKEGELH